MASARDVKKQGLAAITVAFIKLFAMAVLNA